MNIIRFAIENPTKVASGVILILLFGLLSFFSIPVQLTPDVDQPRITVTTRWTGASPQEIENEIIDRQEKKLKSVTDLRKMTSSSKRGEGTVTLEFNVGADKDAALRDTIEKINQVGSYPEEVNLPETKASDAALDSPIAWLMFRADTDDISSMRDFVDDNVRPLLERVPGVAAVDIYGGREREVQIVVDPAKMAARGIGFRALELALRSQNENRSAGTISQSKREYTYRTVGEFRSVEDVSNTVVAYNSGGPIYVRDIGTVILTHQKQYSFVRSKGDYVLALPVRRATGANVMKTMAALKKQVEYINKTVLEPRQQSMRVTQSYDETAYIESSINLVINNIFFGGLLATVVLLIFLRSTSATLIVALTIPISVIGAFLMVTILGRNLNVIMLAGMAFAVGMVVDNAVVVLENIFRHREAGMSRRDAALHGTAEVWGAILASTLTTIAVFLPVIFIKEEAGELFADIAIAISTAVGLSLVIAVAVIPTVAARILRASKATGSRTKVSQFGESIASLVAWINKRTSSRIAVVGGLTVLALVGSRLLVPPASYLPSGNKNLVFGGLQLPPGYSLDELRRVGEAIEKDARPFWEAEVGSEQAANLPEIEMRIGDRMHGTNVPIKPPPIDNFFFVSFGGGAFAGCSSKVPEVVSPLAQVLNQAAWKIPAISCYFGQASLFGRSLSGGNIIELEMRCDNETSLMNAAKAFGPRARKLGMHARSTPSAFDLGRPEYQARIDRVKAADVGLNVSDIGFALEACVNGAFVGNFRDKGDEIDLVIKVEGTSGKGLSDISTIPIFTPSGNIIPLNSVVSFELHFEPQEITHSESMKSILFNLTPPKGVALEAAMDDVQLNIIEPMRKEGVIGKDVIVSMEGNADKLIQTRRALIGSYKGLLTRPAVFGMQPTTVVGILAIGLCLLGAAIGRTRSTASMIKLPAWMLLGLAFLLLVLNPDFALELLHSRGVLAAVVTYLLMSALFESFVYPLVIMLAVPLATVGGFAGLAIVHWFSSRNPVTPIQELDVLTMLGFVILIGIVVNNAILIVHQSLNNMRSGIEPQEAIRRSVATRVRPIFMTALTSIGGMIPLVVMPGSGSELYRGLGSVLVGGLLVATVFTLFVVPAMFSLLVDLRETTQLRTNEEVTFGDARVEGTPRVAPSLAESAPL
ncbi:MAG: efflux RND transporter permease subunit [Planctomycetes bacterium]|nr:efflux RND transporter permease subunit [Planctomycetota bacterium]